MSATTLLDDPRVKAQVRDIQAYCGQEEDVGEPELEPVGPLPSGDEEWQYVNESRLAVPMVLETGPDGYTATTPVLRGCIAEGDTIEEAIQDFKGALNSLLAAYASEHRAVPWRAEPLRLGEVNTRVLTVLI